MGDLDIPGGGEVDLGEYCRRVEAYLTQVNGGHIVRIVGPGFREVAAKYAGDAGAAGRLAAKLKSGGGGAWGTVPMPPQPQVKDADARALVQWILAGAK